jgi:hypothetical protein
VKTITPPMLYAPNPLAGYSHASQKYVTARAISKLPDDTVMIRLVKQNTVKEIAGMFNCHIKTVYKRLAKLRAAGLVK